MEMPETANIHRLAEDLAQAINQSQARQRYEQAKANAEADASLWHMLQEFKDMQRDYYLQQSDNFDAERQLSQHYSALTLHDLAREFLEAEAQLLALLADVQERVSQSAGIVYNF